MSTYPPQLPHRLQSLLGQAQDLHLGREGAGYGTVRHWRVSPEITENQNDFPVTLAPQFRLTSEKFSDTQPQRDAGVNAARECGIVAQCSDNNRAQIVTIDMALAAEGATVARGIAETARIVRAARLRDLLAAVEEWRRASGPDRTWWRQDALHRLQEWRRLHARPERAAFNAAVARRRAA